MGRLDDIAQRVFSPTARGARNQLSEQAFPKWMSMLHAAAEYHSSSETAANDKAAPWANRIVERWAGSTQVGLPARRLAHALEQKRRRPRKRSEDGGRYPGQRDRAPRYPVHIVQALSPG